MAKIFGGPTVLPRLLSSYAGSEADLANLLELWPAKLLESEVPENVLDKSILSRIFQPRWVRLLDTKDHKFEQKEAQERTYCAAICASSAKFLGRNVFERIRVEDILGMIDTFDLPKLGRNKHDKLVIHGIRKGGDSNCYQHRGDFHSRKVH